MGGFGGRRVIVPHSSRKPEYSPIFCAAGRNGIWGRLVGILCHTEDRKPAVGWRTT